MWNRLDYRPLEEWSLPSLPLPSIALNFPTAPAMLGNVALWKPSNTSSHSFGGMLLLEEVFLLAWSIFLRSRCRCWGHCDDPSRPCCLHFLGIINTFQHLFIGENIDNMTHSRPTETEAKIHHRSPQLMHKPCPQALGALIQGECSAASRMYIPKSMWPQVKYAETKSPR